MDLSQAMGALEKAGTAQNRKVYANHGVAGPSFGVSFAALKKLKKQIGTDQELARQLWATVNHDARILACMVADGSAATSGELEAWARQLDNYVICDAFATLVSRTPYALKKFTVWSDRRNQWVSAAAWNVLCHLAVDPASPLTDDFCVEQLERIARDIHSRPNRTRHSMNQALIALGVRNARLEKQALAVAKKIGKVTVDHGATSCKTPDAAAYIHKTVAYQKSKGRR